MKFKKGDWVRCVNAGVISTVAVANKAITEGMVYRVYEQTVKDNVRIIIAPGHIQGFFPDRFVLDETYKITQILTKYDS